MELQTPRQIVQALRQQVDGLQPAGGQITRSLVSSGCVALDGLLPAGGFVRGSLIEWLAGDQGSGAGFLSLLIARQAADEGGAIVVLDRDGCFYPPAAAALGIGLEKLIMIRARRQSDELWALDQSLRCKAVAAVWARLESLNDRWFRRFQLAAEQGRTLGMLSRPAKVRGQPSWSDAQFLVQPISSMSGRRLQVQLVRCRGQGGGGVVDLEIDEPTGLLRKANSQNREQPNHENPNRQTSSLHLAAQLAHPKTHRRQARA